MRTEIGTFPFGQPVREVIQMDRSPKQVFVLGVYASAVHARWVGADQKTIVRALAVASEPSIFWRGDDAESIIRQVAILPQLGRLEPAARQYNGPSGIALDELILNPLGLGRTDAWLCDLVPHSCVNPAQAQAIRRAYLPVAQKYGLPAPSVPSLPDVLADDERRAAILSEIQASGAGVLILLGDEPIRWFLAHYDRRWRRLKDFGDGYGRLQAVQLAGRAMQVLPLAHPRQIAKLGRSSVSWYNLHQDWMRRQAERAASAPRIS
jgi:hypothetical protein